MNLRKSTSIPGKPRWLMSQAAPASADPKPGLHGLVARFAEALLPACCLGCNNLCHRPDWLCHVCRGNIDGNLWPCPRCAVPFQLLGQCAECRYDPPSFQSCQAPLLYTGQIRELIHHWKFSGGSELTPMLVKLALEHSRVRQCRRLKFDNTVLVPIPMSLRRRWVRGYNQAVLLTNELSRQLSRTMGQRLCVEHLLGTTSERQQQHRLSRRERQRNAQTRYRCRRSVEGQRVLLVDDVMTTGATLRAASKALLDAGALEVNAWVLARSPLSSNAGSDLTQQWIE